MSMRKLWFSEGSPFARKVRIVLAEKGLEYQKDVLNGIRPEDTHRTIHPGLMVPVLMDGDLTLFESNLIIDYLLRTYPENPRDMPQPPLVSSLTRPDRHWEDAKTLAILETLANSIANFKLMRDEGATPKLASIIARFSGRPSIASTPVSEVGGRAVRQPGPEKT